MKKNLETVVVNERQLVRIYQEAGTLFLGFMAAFIKSHRGLPYRKAQELVNASGMTAGEPEVEIESNGFFTKVIVSNNNEDNHLIVVHGQNPYHNIEVTFTSSMSCSEAIRTIAKNPSSY